MIEKTFPITQKLLVNVRELTAKLLEILDKEYEHLKLKIDPNVLSSIAANKKDLVAQLEQFSKQLGQVLATEKLLINQSGVVCYLEKAKAANLDTFEASQCWADITTLSNRCRTLNEKNGASIEILNRHTQRSLQILRGKSQLASTYGPDGSTRSVLFSHTLISV